MSDIASSSSAPRAITWKAKRTPENMALIKVNPSQIVDKLFPNSELYEGVQAPEELTLADLLNELGRQIMKKLHQQFQQAAALVEEKIYERDAAMNVTQQRYKEAARMLEECLRREVKAIAERENAMDWEPTA